jgi:rhamnulokinase
VSDTPAPTSVRLDPDARFHVAIDLGAGSGRAFLGAIGTGQRDASSGKPAFLLEEVHRFHYAPRHADGRLRWDIARLFEGITTGLAHAQTRADGLLATARGGARLHSIGVDSWAVDYGLLDADDRLIEEPICYRDERTAGVMDDVLARVPREEMFARTGIQFLSLNTIYQLAAHQRDGFPAQARRLLLIPDLCHHFLCGSRLGERTNASTTQLLDVRTGTWDDELFERLGLGAIRPLMPDIVNAGAELGVLRHSIASADSGSDINTAGAYRARDAERDSPSGGATAHAPRVIAPATHDTASAVAGTPLEPGWAFISSGTWSLVGVERDTPQLDPAAARANFTNEAGVDGTVRFLTNVMGLWLLESCRKEWAAAGYTADLPTLLSRVAAAPGFAGFVCPDAPRFFNPPHMTRELQSALADSGQTAHDDPVLLAKVILDSLAARYASVLDTIERLTSHPISGIHIVGGGSQNAYLNQATADAARRTVMAGPVEATAIGNLVVQAIASGELPSLSAARQRVRAALQIRRFDPRDTTNWGDARARYREIEAAALA